MPDVDTPPLTTPRTCALCGRGAGMHAPDCSAGFDSAVAQDIFDEAETTKRDALVGAKVGDYLIQRRIGSGGMGIVYEAVQPQIGRKVAVKVLRPDVAHSSADMKGLLAEARAANATRQRGIIDIFGFGELAGVGQYLVMEYLDGTPLDQIIDERAPLAQLETIELLIPVLESLSAAHAAGVIHRDLKPSNVFVVREPSGKRYTKLLDFGLAKHTVPGPSGDSRPSLIVGTPQYMAPEQSAAGKVGPRTDLYAIGVMAFEMLSGKLPIGGASAVELVFNQINAAPTPLATYVDVLPEMEDLVMRLLAKDPLQRPSSAMMVQAELRQIDTLLHLHTTLIGTSANSNALPTEAPKAPVARKRPTARWVGAGLAALVAVAIVGWVIERVGSRPPPSAPAEPIVPVLTVAKIEPPVPAPQTAVTPPAPVQKSEAAPKSRLVKQKPHGTARPPPTATASRLTEETSAVAPPPPANGFLKLRALGPGIAEVYIDGDGRPRGRVPAGEPFELPPGRHRIQVRRGDQLLDDQSFVITSAQTTPLSVSVTPH